MEILLLAPSPPLLFMGEEFAAASPFLFFCDFQGELASAVTNGRRNEFSRFAKFTAPEVREQIPNPNAEQTYLLSKLDWSNLSREPHKDWLQFYRELLSIRQRKIVPLLNKPCHSRIESCDENKRAFAISWLSDNGALKLYANLGDEQTAVSKPSDAEQVYSSSSEVSQVFAEGKLRAWSVIWLLKN